MSNPQKKTTNLPGRKRGNQDDKKHLEPCTCNVLMDSENQKFSISNIEKVAKYFSKNGSISELCPYFLSELQHYVVNPKVVENYLDMIKIQAMTFSLVESIKVHPSKINMPILKDYVIFESEKEKEIKQINDDEKLTDIISNCYEINDGNDITKFICYIGKTAEKKDIFLMVNNWILKICGKSLYAYLIGRKLENSTNEQRENIKKMIEGREDKHSYGDIRKGLTKKRSYVRFVKHMFVGDYKPNLAPDSEAWLAIYFTASIICESARNFRLIPLVLMALDMFESTKAENQEKAEKFFFENHPMARGGSWINRNGHGYSGSVKPVTPVDSSELVKKKPKNVNNRLEEVLGHECTMFNNWNKMIDQGNKPELIFSIAVKFKIFSDDKCRGVFLEKYTLQ